MFFKKKQKTIWDLADNFIENIKFTREEVENSHISEFLDEIKIYLDTFEKNYTRLIERYRYDEPKLKQILADSFNYNEILSTWIYQRELGEWGDPNEYFKVMKPLHIRQDEIQSRFKGLLGDEYIDPTKLSN